MAVTPIRLAMNTPLHHSTLLRPTLIPHASFTGCISGQSALLLGHGKIRSIATRTPAMSQYSALTCRRKSDPRCHPPLLRRPKVCPGQIQTRQLSGFEDRMRRKLERDVDNIAGAVARIEAKQPDLAKIIDAGLKHDRTHADKWKNWRGQLVTIMLSMGKVKKTVNNMRYLYTEMMRQPNLRTAINLSYSKIKEAYKAVRHLNNSLSSLQTEIGKHLSQNKIKLKGIDLKVLKPDLESSDSLMAWAIVLPLGIWFMPEILAFLGFPALMNWSREPAKAIIERTKERGLDPENPWDRLKCDRGTDLSRSLVGLPPYGEPKQTVLPEHGMDSVDPYGADVPSDEPRGGDGSQD